MVAHTAKSLHAHTGLDMVISQKPLEEGRSRGGEKEAHSGIFRPCLWRDNQIRQNNLARCCYEIGIYLCF